MTCPICNWNGQFLSFGNRQNAQCPQCKSLERHRSYYLYFKKILPIDKEIKLLHFAPEKSLTKFFRSYSNIKYISADLVAKKAMVIEDMTKLSFKDNTFDIVFAVHVLEHIVNDIKAMEEVYRVLKIGGFAILQVPIKNINITLEDKNIVTKQDRIKFYGQADHVRYYGLDYKDRLNKVGFNVIVNHFFNELDECLIIKYGLKKEDIFICRR